MHELLATLNCRELLVHILKVFSTSGQVFSSMLETLVITKSSVMTWALEALSQVIPR